MKISRKAQPTSAVGDENASLSVHCSDVHRNHPLGEELLVCFLKAIHDAMTPGVSRIRPRRAKRRIEVPSPYGPVFIGMFLCSAGAWNTKYPQRFVAAMESHGTAICHGLERCLANGKSSYQLAKKLVEFFLGKKATHKRIQYVDAQVKGFLADHSLSTYREATAAKDAEAILRYVESKGLPARVVQITEAGPRVSLFVLSSLARVPLNSIERYGGSDSLQRQLDALAILSRWSDQRRLFLPTRNKPHGRETFPGLVVDFKNLRVDRGGLLDDMLEALPTPADHHETQAMLRQIQWLVAPEAGKRWDGISKDSQRVLGIKVSKLTQADAIRLVDGLENRLSKGSCTVRTRSDYVAAFKAQLIDAFERHQKILRFSRKMPVQEARQNRGLLSDQPDARAIDPENRPAIINVAWGSPEEAKKKATAHLEDRLARVHAACDEEINAFLDWRAFLEEVGRNPLPAGMRRHADAIIGVSSSPKWLAHWMETADLADIARVIVEATHTKELYREAQDFAWRSKLYQFRISRAFPRLAERFPALIDWCGAVSKGPARLSWVALSAWYVPRWVQLAIEIKIQAETGWNRATVRNLRADGISIRGSAVELQAVKGKTGEMQYGGTDSADRHLLSGLKLMLEHNQHVDAYWGRERQGVFVAMVAKKDHHRVFGMGTEDKLRKKFIAKHGLPHFTREQLRNQRMATRFLIDEDPHEIQASMGHADLATTSTYLRHAVIEILNRANIAKFQRQLAATIVWAVEGDDYVEKRGMDRSEVDRRLLLFPISDHATAEQAMPPTCDVWMANPAAPLTLDLLRIQHLARQRAYYAAHWQRLRAQAPDRFEHIHRPRIEFTAALWAIVSDSPYAALLEAST